MRDLPVLLAAPTLKRRGGPWREAIFFLIAFAAMFGGAMLTLDLVANTRAGGTPTEPIAHHDR